MTSENTPSAADFRAVAGYDMERARTLLGDAEQELALHGNAMSRAEFARAAAAVAGGYLGFAHLGLVQADRVEDKPSLTAMTAAYETTAALAQLHLDALTTEQPQDGITLAEAIASANERRCRIEEALTWIDDPDDASHELQLAKIRECLEGPRG